MQKSYKIIIAQFSPALGMVPANVSTVCSLAKKARKAGANLFVTPELALNGYLLEDLAIDTALTAHSAAITSLAAASKGMDMLVGAAFEDGAARVVNSALYFSGGKFKGRQDKLYLPSYGMFDESRYFQAGNNLELFDLGPFKAALLLCEDAWHATLAVQAVQRGATMLVVLSSSPARGYKSGQGSPSIRRTWHRILGSAAETLGVPVVFANRVGVEDGVTFWGGSLVLAADGETLAEAPLYKDALLEVELDPTAFKRARRAAPVALQERNDYNAREFAKIAGWQLAPVRTLAKKRK